MRNTHPRELEVYQTPNGREPFTEWLESLRDLKVRRRIQVRLDSLKVGNFGDFQSVGDGVFELRFHFGAGYRIYYGEIRNTIVLLLWGGGKSGQARDINRAKTYWREYKETQL